MLVHVSGNNETTVHVENYNVGQKMLTEMCNWSFMSMAVVEELVHVHDNG